MQQLIRFWKVAALFPYNDISASQPVNSKQWCQLFSLLWLLMDLAVSLDLIAARLKDGTYRTQAQIKQGILLPVLRGLGWDDANTLEVCPDYSIQTRSVDYALVLGNNPDVVIEVKQADGANIKADHAVLDFVSRTKIPVCIFTDGQHWDFYSGTAICDHSNRFFAAIDLINDAPNDIEETFRAFLEKELALGENRVKVVEATHDAKRRRETTLKQIASVWENLASEPVNDILVDLLSEEMVLLTGHNPNKEDVHYFISNLYLSVSH